MAIPDYESIMLPLLQMAEKANEVSTKNAYDEMAQHFNLSEEERKTLQPSGRMLLFNNRLLWAKHYLAKAGLLEIPKRAVFKITSRGKEILDEKPPKLDCKYLNRFPEFREFRKPQEKSPESPKGKGLQDEPEAKTPNELIEEAYAQIREALTDELLSKVKSCSPAFFEWLVVELLVKMGYGGSIHEAGKVIGKVGDGGIDGVIKEDKLGLDLIYIQAKRWETNVGRPLVQSFAGALQGVRARKGIMVTTSGFTEEARQYISTIDSKIVLIDGSTLAELMIDYDLGVSKISSFEVKRLDSDYFSDE